MLPKLNDISYRHDIHTIDFKGLNVNNSRLDGELSNCTNMTSDKLPVLSTRSHRGIFKDIDKVGEMGSHGEHFYYTRLNEFYFDDKKKGDIVAGNKQIAIMNNFIVIFPDKKAYDIENDKFEDMEKEVTCTTIDYYSDKIIVGGADLQNTFNVGDGLKIVGGIHSDKVVVIESFENGNTIIVGTNTFPEESHETNVRLKREIPDLEFVVEHENRLWGCKGNEIFASRQGSHINFNIFVGLSSDSYAADVATPGPFTAAINYNNNLIFFKEDVIHKVYGNKPSNYQIITHHTPGVQKLNPKSLCIADGVLFYKTLKHIVAYNGTVPEVISDKINLKGVISCVGGSDGYKLYFSLYREPGGYELYTYDTRKNIWLKEDTTMFHRFCLHGGNVLGADHEKIYTMASEAEEVIPFAVEFGPFTEDVKDKKGYSKLNMECQLKPNATLKVWIKHDDEAYTQIATLIGKEKFHRLPIQPKRCNTFSIKLEGSGDFELHSLTRSFRVRSDK